jgi:hypothetical protein
VLAASAIVFRVDQSAAGSALDDQCGEDRADCPHDYDHASDQARERRDFGLFIGLGSGALVGLGLAIIGIVTSPSPGHAAASRWRPIASPGPAWFVSGAEMKFE